MIILLDKTDLDCCIGALLLNPEEIIPIGDELVPDNDLLERLKDQSVIIIGKNDAYVESVLEVTKDIVVFHHDLNEVDDYSWSYSVVTCYSFCSYAFFHSPMKHLKHVKEIRNFVEIDLKGSYSNKSIYFMKGMSNIEPLSQEFRDVINNGYKDVIQKGKRIIQRRIRRNK